MSLYTPELVYVTGQNFTKLDELARLNGESLDAYVDNGLQLGIGLAGIALEEAPDVVHLGLEQPAAAGDDLPSIELWAIDFSDAVEVTQIELPAELKAYDAEMEAGPRRPLLIRDTLLTEVENMADIVSTSRESFIGMSLFYYAHWQRTLRYGGSVLLRDSGGEFTVLSFDDED